MESTITPLTSLRLVALLGAILAGNAFFSASARAASSPPVSITNVQVSHDTYLAHSEPAVAENPTNPKNLIAGSKMFTDPASYQFKIGTYYSTDAGKTWHDDGFLPGFDSYPVVSDISFAFDASGAAYACVLAEDAQGRSGIFVSVSTDGGASWSNPHTVFFDPTRATFSDKPWIGIDRSNSAYRGSIYVAWNLDDVSNTKDPDGGDRGTGGDAVFHNQQVSDSNLTTGLVVAHSTDGAASWSQPVTLVPFTANSQQFALGAIPAVGPNGHLYIAYLKWNDTSTGAAPNTMEMRSSSDGGVTFGPARTVVNRVEGLPNTLRNSTFRNLSMPSFVVSPKDGSMAIVWADMRNGDADVLLSRSKTGTSWSQPYRVNHDHLGNGKDQFQPEIAVAPNGVYTCAWFDRRHDPNNRLIDEEIAQSADGAKTFGHNFRITTTSWDASIDAPHPSDDPKVTFIGDYQGLAVDNSTVHPLWNDTQNAKSQEIRSAVIAEHVFTARH
jgi:hypothetical protein